MSVEHAAKGLLKTRRGVMSDMERTAKAFFEACETGEGWEACKQFCKPDATFSCQADALADVKTLPGIYRLDERLI